MTEIKEKKGLIDKISGSRRGFMKGLATVAAATPVIGSLFKPKDADAALATAGWRRWDTRFPPQPARADASLPALCTVSTNIAAMSLGGQIVLKR